jgi:hypothetical protein
MKLFKRNCYLYKVVQVNDKSGKTANLTNAVITQGSEELEMNNHSGTSGVLGHGNSELCQSSVSSNISLNHKE